ncbi:MAG: thioredoxin family protein [Clostridiales bacterium]|nr:thioredoxin family protein [Clostridiales bacterium]
MINVDDKSFREEIVEGGQPAMVEFYSSSCLPCRRMEPIMEELSDESRDIKIAKINISEGVKTASEYGVMASPTFLFFKGGREVGRLVGFMEKQDLERAADEVLF